VLPQLLGASFELLAKVCHLILQNLNQRFIFLTLSLTSSLRSATA
jgi:hypothetical protein